MSTLSGYIEKLGCDDEAERAFAAEDIGYLNQAEGVCPLVEQLDRESSPAVREIIFQALIRIDADQAIESSVQLFTSENPQVRNQAVDVLRHKDGRSIPYLEKAMRSGDKSVRKLVLDVLKGNSVDDATQIYEAALADPDINVMITAIENLGEMDFEKYRSALEGLLEAGSHPMLIVACVDSLVKLGHHSSLAAIGRCFPDIQKSPDFSSHIYLKALAALGTDLEFEQVANWLTVCAPHLRSPILSTLMSIYPRCKRSNVSDWIRPLLKTLAMTDEEPLCRSKAVQALGLSNHREDTYSFLLPCLFDTERLVRLAAAQTILSTGHPGWKNAFAERAINETDMEVLKVLKC